MFEVTITRLEAIAAKQIAIASILVATETTKAVATFGASSATAVLANIALTTAQLALAAEVGAETVIIASRAAMVNAMISVRGLQASSAGESTATAAAAARTA